MLYEANLENLWLGEITKGRKTQEARLSKDKWSKMKVGDTIIFSGRNGYKAVVKIVSLRYYFNFTECYKAEGESLICSEILGKFRITAESIYSCIYDDCDINRYGVVSVGMNLIDFC